MKKLLLLSAIALGALAAKADYTDYYRVYYNGEEITNGSTIYCDHYVDNTDQSGFNMGYAYEANISFINQNDYWIPLYTDQGFLDLPTKEDFTNQDPIDYTSNNWFTKWGTPSLCFAGAGEEGKDSNCLMLPTVAIVPDNRYDCFEWQFHVQQIDPATITSRYTLTTIACNGDKVDYEFIEDGEFTVTIEFSSMAGVNGIEADSNVSPEYFTLQGVRVQNPENGLYIVKRGNKVTKEIVR